MDMSDVKRLMSKIFRVEASGSQGQEDWAAKINEYREQVLEQREWPEDKLELVEKVIAKVEDCISASATETLREINTAHKSGTSPEALYEKRLADFMVSNPDIAEQLDDNGITVDDITKISKKSPDTTLYTQYCVKAVAEREPEEALVCG